MEAVIVKKTVGKSAKRQTTIPQVKVMQSKTVMRKPGKNRRKREYQKFVIA